MFGLVYQGHILRRGGEGIGGPGKIRVGQTGAFSHKNLNCELIGQNGYSFE